MDPAPAPPAPPSPPSHPRYFVHVFIDITENNFFMFYHQPLDHHVNWYDPNNEIITTVWHMDENCRNRSGLTLSHRKKFNEENVHTFDNIANTTACFVFSFDNDINLCEMWFPCPHCVIQNHTIFESHSHEFVMELINNTPVLPPILVNILDHTNTTILDEDDNVIIIGTLMHAFVMRGNDIYYYHL